MVFTQAQKCDIKTIIQETIRELLTDKTFIASIALKVAETLDIPQEIDKKFHESKLEITDLQNEVESLNMKLKKMEQSTRKNNVRIYGIPESQGEQSQDIIEIVNEKTRINISSENIGSVYRIGKATVNGNRAILVRFKEYTYKEEVMKKRKILKGSQVVIADDLTKENHNILKEAVLKLGKRNVWCLGGRIYFRKGDDKFTIERMEDVAKLSSA